MYSSLISMVEKAKRYASEPERVSLQGLEVRFRGNNDIHKVSLDGDDWSCECDHFSAHGLCTHVMTLQRLFAANLSEAQRFTQERVTQERVTQERVTQERVTQERVTA